MSTALNWIQDILDVWTYYHILVDTSIELIVIHLFLAIVTKTHAGQEALHLEDKLVLLSGGQTEWWHCVNIFVAFLYLFFKFDCLLTNTHGLTASYISLDFS